MTKTRSFLRACLASLSPKFSLARYDSETTALLRQARNARRCKEMSLEESFEAAAAFEAQARERQEMRPLFVAALANASHQEER